MARGCPGGGSTVAALSFALGIFSAVYFGASFVVAPGPSARHLRTTSVDARNTIPVQNVFAGSSVFCLSSVASVVGLVVVARSVVVRRAEKPLIPRPEDNLNDPRFPLFSGSAGGYMSKATRERHAITWTAPEEAVFEMPTGGGAIMNKGENLCYFRKKEQCICLGKELRKMKIENYKIYRIQKDGTVIFLHPADGVFPEKVNKGRVQVNGRPFTVCQNPQPAEVKWTKYHFKSYEADALTTLFVKARIEAFSDEENLFPIPQPNSLDEPDKVVDAKEMRKILEATREKEAKIYESL